MINQYLNVFIVPHQSPLGGWEDVRILRGAPPKPQSFLNQTRRNIIQKYSKLKHKDEQAQVYKYLPISTGVLALIVAIVAWWQKMSFLIYLRP